MDFHLAALGAIMSAAVTGCHVQGETHTTSPANAADLLQHLAEHSRLDDDAYLASAARLAFFTYALVEYGKGRTCGLPPATIEKIRDDSAQLSDLVSNVEFHAVNFRGGDGFCESASDEQVAVACRSLERNCLAIQGVVFCDIQYLHRLRWIARSTYQLAMFSYAAGWDTLSILPSELLVDIAQYEAAYYRPEGNPEATQQLLLFLMFGDGNQHYEQEYYSLLLEQIEYSTLGVLVAHEFTHAHSYLCGPGDPSAEAYEAMERYRALTCTPATDLTEAEADVRAYEYIVRNMEIVERERERLERDAEASNRQMSPKKTSCPRSHPPDIDTNLVPAKSFDICAAAERMRKSAAAIILAAVLETYRYEFISQIADSTNVPNVFLSEEGAIREMIDSVDSKQRAMLDSAQVHDSGILSAPYYATLGYMSRSDQMRINSGGFHMDASYRMLLAVRAISTHRLEGNHVNTFWAGPAQAWGFAIGRMSYIAERQCGAAPDAATASVREEVAWAVRGWLPPLTLFDALTRNRRFSFTE
ncbi:MAG: hypothetical protein R6X02_36210 [Enhygromyxa sp.]